MKILVVGDFLCDIYEPALYNAFLKLGHRVIKFATGDYFKEKTFFQRLQNKFSFGSIIRKINSDLIETAGKERPDLVFVYRGNHIYSAAIKKIKQSGAVIFGYNNDDPFSDGHPAYFWRHFKKSIPYYDHIFVYRRKNLHDYKKINYTKISLLTAYYIEEDNFPIEIEKLPTDKYVCDAVFAGHYENDGRDEYIKAIIDGGINFKLFGGASWSMSKYYDFFCQQLGEPVYLKEDYNICLNSVKIALVFLSKLNNDTYTRRCFEITAAKTFMLSEYTDDLNSMFQEGREAEYFRNKEEMLRKIRYYLTHGEDRKRIAEAGYQRLLRDGHEIKDRAKEIIKVFNGYKTIKT